MGREQNLVGFLRSSLARSTVRPERDPQSGPRNYLSLPGFDADKGIVRRKEPPGEMRGPGDADAEVADPADFGAGRRSVKGPLRIDTKIRPVVLTSDAHGDCQFAWAGA